MELTNRLKLIFDLIPDGATLADIGTDHAYLPVYCLLNGKIKSAIAMDINEGPLSSAKAHAAKYGVLKNVALRLSDGMKELKKGEASVVVIAGMGGLLIKKIISESLEKIDENTLLILQPQLAKRELREYLSANKIGITAEYIAKEGDKLYTVITAAKGENFALSEKEALIGKNAGITSPELYGEYLEKNIKTLKKIVCGIEKSEKKEGLEKAKRELEIFEKELLSYESK